MSTTPEQPRPLPAPGLYPDRYDLIDAWRGLAALAVVFHHVTGIIVGHAAVMLFFVISGYCIAASADACQRKGWGFKQFMWRRIRRIYPPYLFSVAFWGATRLLKLALLKGGVMDPKQTNPTDMIRPWWEWLQQFTLTQWITLVSHPVSWPATNPSLFVAAYWSLCYEEQFYLLMGLMVLLATRLRIGMLTMCLILAMPALAWNLTHAAVSTGFTHVDPNVTPLATISYGWFLDYWILFAVGVLVFHRLCRIASARHRLAIDLTLGATFAVSVYLRWFAGIHWVGPPEPDYLRVFWEELAVASGFALLLIGTRPLSEAIAKRSLFKPFAALGHITFSLYLIHQFNLIAVNTVVVKALSFITPVSKFAAENPHGIRELSWALQIAGHIAMATIFWYFCERPFLNKPISPRTPPPATPPPSGHVDRP